MLLFKSASIATGMRKRADLRASFVRWMQAEMRGTQSEVSVTQAEVSLTQVEVNITQSHADLRITQM